MTIFISVRECHIVNPLSKMDPLAKACKIIDLKLRRNYLLKVWRIFLFQLLKNVTSLLSQVITFVTSLHKCWVEFSGSPYVLSFLFWIFLRYLQAELFDKFLHGSTLEECYSAVASVANRWLDLLDVCEQTSYLIFIQSWKLLQTPYCSTLFFIWMSFLYWW